MRTASLADLESAIAAGEGDEVRLAGGLPVGATGSFSLLAVVAVPLFLLMSGRWRGGQAASPGARRLTGGWAFLLVYLLSSTNG